MADRIIPSVNSLVKYDNAVLVTKHTDKKLPPIKVQPGISASATAPKPGTSAADLRKETDEILNSILPPKEWTEDNQLWRQQVSSTPATRLDVINLQEQLDMRLQQRQARETGICPVRRELYTQCFDEIIRQVTINCAERGLLLLRVRDELRMTVAAYQALYESSIAFGMRKALQAEQGKADLEKDVKDLRDDKEKLDKSLQEERTKADQQERRSIEQRAAEEKKHSEEITFLKKTNQQLKTQLEGIIAPKK
ncbi:33 kDa inner dynein arm light chain, axonemal [Thrips palmi]|uniref:33 kDa inner dynein arm light chain, axonemal n=1 Tax=Thrips palmi TaxID=161013 RepID=A0A6P9AA10_THRPL|nr:33 kDa inner dynein arm light chain, axonemal [Thrips palmi]